MKNWLRPACVGLFATILFLAGCGQKGPLYLPEKDDSSVESSAESVVDEE